MRPYTDGGRKEPDRWGSYFYQPFAWRGFYDFGCGALGDMACHILGAPNMALHLSKRKIVGVECVKKDGVSAFMFPKASITRYDFAAYEGMPELKVFWYDGLKESPKLPGVPEGEWVGDPPSIMRTGGPGGPGGPGAPGGQGPARGQGRGGFGGMMAPAYEFRSPGRVFNWDEFQAMREPGAQLRFPTPDGSVFIGDKGLLTTGTYGEVTRLLPVEKMKDYRMPPPMLTRSPGHMRDFIRACKGGDPACSNFDVAAPFVEWMLLGVIALRHEGKLEYDADKMRITNNVEANKLLMPYIRRGWDFRALKL
jgi:hypothetical protein